MRAAYRSLSLRVVFMVNRSKYSQWMTHERTHVHTHSRTHTRMHARTHTLWMIETLSARNPITVCCTALQTALSKFY